MNPICIIDDQEQICATLSEVLSDEGYETISFNDAESFWQELDDKEPSLVLLDIWLPGVDGLELLKQLVARFPALPVIMMSGHAGIETAVKAIKAGAYDFIEKPFHLEVILEKVEAAIKQLPEVSDSSTTQTNGNNTLEAQSAVPKGPAEIIVSGEPQRTIAEVVVLNGVGLLSGRKTGIILSPLGVNEGIVFQTLDGQKIPGHITFLENYEQINPARNVFSANSTVLKNGGYQIRTIEHLMATFSALGITNVLVKSDDEVPNIDGSARDFCELIEEAGIIEQNSPKKVAVIREKISLGIEKPQEKHLYVEPFDGFEIVMRVDYPEPIGEQFLIFNPEKNDFSKEIAPARSFNTFENIEMAQRLGKVGGGYLNSHIIMHEGRVINTELRYPDEFVRHKMLDILGDLYLLGYPVRGRVTANMTSHGYNQALTKRIFEAIQGEK